MSPTLKTKNVFLTGGAQGLGKSYMEALLAEGARVVFGDINATIGNATEKELAQKYGKDNVKFIQFDVTDGSKFKEAFQTGVDFLGYVDLMVNNAGMMAESLWEKMITLNFAGVVRGTYLAYEHMRKDKGGKGGRIVNISSEFGLLDLPFVPVYHATKHAVRSFTSCLAVAPDRQKIGIEYAVLCPGSTDTDLIKLDESKMRHFELHDPALMAQITSSVERVQSAFMKLVHLDQMNNAILYVSVSQITFVKMEKVDLGEEWPVLTDSAAGTS